MAAASVIGTISAADAVGIVAVITAVVAAAVVTVLAATRSRHAVESRIQRMADRLGAPPPIESGLNGALDRLSDAVDASALGAARRVEVLLARALDAIPQGVVLYAPDGSQVMRNRAATDILDPRRGGPDLDRLMWDLIDRGFAGRHDSRTLDLEGPPTRTYLLTGLPLPARHDRVIERFAPPPGEDVGGDRRRGGANDQDDWIHDGAITSTADLIERGVRVGGVVIVIDDISERRRVDALRRDFVSNISHELKTPVGALGLLAETLIAETTASDEDGLDPTSAAVVQRLAARLHHEALRMGRTIDDLLELSRIEVGEPPTNELIPVVQILADAVERVRPAAELRDVKVEVGCSPPQLAVAGDRRQLVSAVANLVDNAVKYSDPGSMVYVSGHGAGRWAELSIEDRGMGIPRPHLERIFERFYRVDQARSRETGGTGLGLAIVRHVAGNHHGTVLVESNEGVGSTFTLRLPIAGARDAVAAELAGETSSTKPSDTRMEIPREQ